MRYYIGIDGGGSKTKAVLTDENYKTFCEEEASATNPNSVGYEKSAEIISSLVLSLIEKSNLSISQETILSRAGIAGVGRIAALQKLNKNIQIYFQKYNINIPFELTTDIEITHNGALAGDAGIILIAGTGSIAYGKDSLGNTYRAGGYGKIIGDEGSGYSIGRKALNLLSKFFDGRASNSLLIESLINHFEILSAEQLIDKVNSGILEIASVVPVVFSSAEKDDAAAVKILNEESDELISLLISLIKKMKHKTKNLVLCGGLLSSNNIYSYMIKERILKNIPDILIRDSKYPPEIGAIIQFKHPIKY